MTTIPTATFAALAHVMAKRDVRYYVRYYLCGVLLDGTQAVATDGHVMAVASWDGDACPRIIIPADIVKAAAKAKSDTVTLEPIGDGRYLLAGQAFAPIDGRYPDWRAAMDFGNMKREDAAVEGALLARVGDAVAAAGKAIKARHAGVTVRPVGERAVPWAATFSSVGNFRLSGVILNLRGMVADPLAAVESERAQ